jgi:putative Holliday junction resolvase
MPEKLPNAVLGFDFGLSRIGVAAGQMITKTATALPTLPAKQGKPDWAMVGKYIKEWRPQALIVGIPLLMDDKEQPLTRHARAFAQQLQQQFKLPVYEADERLTTREARLQLNDLPDKRFYHKVDGLAACLILETWMNAQ